jgi:hypothetical protein
MIRKYFEGFIQKSISFSEKINIVSVILLSILYIALAVVINQGGIIHNEMYVRMPAHLSQMPVLSIIYGPDMDQYARPRQLSFLFDIVDAYFILFCVRLGIPNFLSFTHYLFVVLTGVASWTFFTRKLQINRLLALLLVGVFYTSSVAVFGFYLRTAKIGAALMVVILAILIYLTAVSQSGWSNRKRWLTGLAIFAVALASSLFDEEGLFMVGLALLVSIWLAFATHGPNRLCALVALLAAILAAGIYDLVLFPWISYAVNHVSPTWDYQTGIPISLELIGKYINEGWSLLLSTSRFLLGNISEFEVVLVIIAILLFSIIPQLLSGRKSFILRFTPLALVLFILGSSWLMFAVMYARHNPIIWPDVRRFYYWLPTTALFMITLPILLRPLLVNCQANRTRFFVVLVILLFLISGNINALPEANATIHQGRMAEAFARTAQVLEGLRNRRNPSYQPSDEVARNPIYQLLNYRIILR